MTTDPDEELWSQRISDEFATQQRILKSARQNLEHSLSRLEQQEKRIARLVNMRGQPRILVRITPGPPPTTYHSADEPCGRVKYRDSFKEMLLGEASAGLHACTACAYELKYKRVAKKK